MPTTIPHYLSDREENGTRDLAYRIGKLEAGVVVLADRIHKYNSCHEAASGRFCSTKGGAAGALNPKEQNVALDKLESLLLTGGPSNKGIQFTDREKAWLKQTVDDEDYKVYRGISLVRSRVPAENRAAVNALKPGDTLPPSLLKESFGGEHASYTRSKGVASHYASGGTVSVVTEATVPSSKVLFDSKNYKRLNAPRLNEHSSYFKSEKEVIVSERGLRPTVIKTKGFMR